MARRVSDLLDQRGRRRRGSGHVRRRVVEVLEVAAGGPARNVHVEIPAVAMRLHKLGLDRRWVRAGLHDNVPRRALRREGLDVHARHDLPRVHADRPKSVTVMIQADDHHVHVLRVPLQPVHEEAPQAPELNELRQFVGEAKGLVGRLTASQLVGRRGQAVVDVRRKEVRL